MHTVIAVALDLKLAYQKRLDDERQEDAFQHGAGGNASSRSRCLLKFEDVYVLLQVRIVVGSA